MKYALADHPTNDTPSTGWLSFITQDFPGGLFRGKPSAKTFDTPEEAAEYLKNHGNPDLPELFVRPIA